VRGNLKGLKARQHIKLGDVETAVAVDLVRVLDDIEIKPSALTLAASSGAPLVTDILHVVTELASEVSREGAGTDASRVCLDDTNHGLDSLRWDTETSADAADCCVA